MKAPCGVEIEVGQMWEEVKPRLSRRVMVKGTTTRWQGRVYTAKGRVLQDVVIIECNGRKTFAKLSRFNGKRGGYKLVS